MQKEPSAGFGGRVRGFRPRARLSAVLVFLSLLPAIAARAEDASSTHTRKRNNQAPEPPPSPPEAPPPPDYSGQIKALEAQAAAQSAEVAALRAALEKEKAEARANEEALKPPPPPPPPSPPPPPPPPVFRFSGFMEVDYLHNQTSQNQLDPTSSQSLNLDRFLLRRVRPRLDINHGLIQGVLQIDLNTVNGAQVRPWDVEVSIRSPAAWSSEEVPIIMATAGLMLIPFGYEVQQADTDRLFLERSNMEQAFWNGEHDLGIRLQGGWRFLRYGIALMNGEPIGEKTFPLIDPNAFKDVVGRLGIDTDIVRGLNVRAGVSGTKGEGFHAGTPATKPTIVWHDLNNDGVVEANEIQVVPAQDSTPSKSFNRFALGADLGVSYDIPVIGALTVYGEVETATNQDRALFPADPVWEGRDLREFGYYVALTQQLSKYATIGVRYDSYQPDIDAADNKVANVIPRDASVSTLAAAASAQFHGARFVLEYDHNTNHEGRATTGTPTTLPADQVGVRAEVKF